MLIRRITIACLTALVAVASHADEEEDFEAEKENACILVSSRMYMQAMGEEYVYVESGSRRYLLTARRRCPGLDRGFNMQFEGRRRQVCSNNRPAIEYYHQNIEMPACRIDSIRRVKNWQEAQALVLEREQARVKERNEKKARKKAEKKAREEARKNERD